MRGNLRKAVVRRGIIVKEAAFEKIRANFMLDKIIINQIKAAIRETLAGERLNTSAVKSCREGVACLSLSQVTAAGTVWHNSANT